MTTQMRVPSRPRAPWLGRFARQVLREGVIHVSLTILAFLALFLVVDFVEVGNTAQRTAGVTLIRLTLLNLPVATRQMLPIAAPLGAVAAMSTLIRRQEIAAFLAAGASPSALLKPITLLALALALFEIGLTERVIPPSLLARARLKYQLGLSATPPERQPGQRWFKSGEKLFHVQSLADSSGGELAGVEILRVAEGRLLERWDMARLVHRNPGWFGLEVVHRSFGPVPPDETPPFVAQKPRPTQRVRPQTSLPTHREEALTVERFDQLALPLEETPRDFVASLAPPEALRLLELTHTTTARERLGHPAREHRLELLNRAASPIALWLAVLLAGAVALRLGRSPSLATALGAGALIGSAVWILREAARLLGTTGTIAPSASAFIPVFGLGILAMVAWIQAMGRGLAER